MKKYTLYLPLTTFATAFVLGGSLSAQEMTSKSNSMRDHQSQQSTDYRINSQPMTASDIIGMNIDNATSEKIGEIDEIFIDSNTGEVLAVVVSTGGFLGMGEEKSLISPEDLRFNTERTLIQANLTKDQIKTAPRYQEGLTTSVERVRPLGDNRANWNARNERNQNNSSDWDLSNNDRNQMTPVTGSAQKDTRHPTASSERTETSTTKVLGERNSQNQTASTERSERTNRYNSGQSQNRSLVVSELIGMDVENSQGEEVGEVDEVFLNLANNEVVGVTVSTGGFLNMGDRKTLFSLKELSFNSTNDKVVLDYSRDEVRAFPEYKVNDQSVFTALNERTNRLDSNNNAYNSERNTYNSNRINSDSNNSARTEAGNRNNSTSDHSSNMNAFTQGTSSDETAMTASIRSAIREDNSLSSGASNVTVITNKGKVILRGEVDSAVEKTKIEGIARNKAGRRNVTSELTVRDGSTALNQ